jgi:hypothetical protein
MKHFSQIIFQHPVALSSTQVYVVFTVLKCNLFLNKEETQWLEDRIHYHNTHTTAPQQNDISRFGKISYIE